MAKKKQDVSWMSLVLCAVFMANGCAATKVAGRAPKKDMSILDPGTSRSQVVASLGTPILSREKSGTLTDTFAFDPGIAGGVKFARVVVHVFADLCTLFLWELVAWPAESAAASGGNKSKVDVIYDQNETVKYSTFLK